VQVFNNFIDSPEILYYWLTTIRFSNR